MVDVGQGLVLRVVTWNMFCVNSTGNVLYTKLNETRNIA